MALPTFRRQLFSLVLARVCEPRRFIQVLAGPRQVGKTTLVRQVLAEADLPYHYASADAVTLQDGAWVENQWGIGRLRGRESEHGALLVLDEVQKVTAWSEIIKRLWDEDSAAGRSVRVVLLGSAPLLVQRGLGESLAGRFELIRIPHWSYGEMRDAFGWDIERFLYFGGYPGAAPLIGDPNRWASYILDSLVETTLSRDVLLLTRVDKPALLRQLFRLACDYSGQILSYQKMVGQLQDAGNTTTLAHYLQLLEGAGLVAGLQKFSGAQVRQRGSSPKLVVLNTALMSAVSGVAFDEARMDSNVWGRLVESAVGAHLINAGLEVCYWRDRGLEVDYVARRGRVVVAFEVKSGWNKGTHAGLDAFRRTFQPEHALLIGSNGIPLEEFFDRPVTDWLG
jgi:predicted AAA+ superfamily ATPase